jgi:hypothetical protein
MNLELLFWVADRTSNDTLRTIAHSHATKTGELWLRKDNSTVHLCVFNPETGALLKPCTGTPQGYSADSTWSRGQAWGIYGWTMAYRCVLLICTWWCARVFCTRACYLCLHVTLGHVVIIRFWECLCVVSFYQATTSPLSNSLFPIANVT